MEHKLVQGGEVWIPYARSRIRALRGTGLEFISQKYIMPDGATVEVQIAGENEYIRISGGGCTTMMDSGVMDVGSIAEGADATWLPGALIESTNVEDYNAAFTTVTANGRTRPGTTSEGQLSGKITDSSDVFKGLLGTTVGRSFKPEAGNSEDWLLYAKKQMAILCPPSIFTGRCRMYVQALYGLHLYKPDVLDTLGAVVTPGTANQIPQLDTSNPGAAPALLLPSYIHATQDTGTYADVQLSTSCGVYLDEEGGHWLLVPTAGLMAVYPLIGSKCAEKLRRFLWDSPEVMASKRLNDEDKEHLEAYILSTCFPRVSRLQWASGASIVSAFGMGYGWHWNWSTSQADVVINETFAQDATNSAMRSTHYRTAISRFEVIPDVTNSDGSITYRHANVEMTNAVQEGPTDWAIPRGSWCIAEPDWSTLTLTKTTPQHTTRIESSAPFYVFYLRDEIQVCRSTMTYQAATGGVRTMSESFCPSYTYGSSVAYRTLGEHDGYVEDNAGTGFSWKATFAIGATVSPTMYEGLTNTGARSDLGNKAFLGYLVTAPPAYLTSVGPADDVQFNVDYPPYSPVTYHVSGYLYDYAMYSYDITTVSFTEVTSSSATIVVPVYDSQAAYLYAAPTYTRSSTGSIYQWLANLDGFRYKRRWTITESPSGSVYTPVQYDWNDGGGASGASAGTTTATTVTTITNPTATSKLICAAGAIDATFTHLNELLDNVEDGSNASYATISGISSDSPVIAPGYIVPDRGISTAVAAPVIVGWA